MNLKSIDLLSKYLKLEENIKNIKKNIKEQDKEISALKDKKKRNFEKKECIKTFFMQFFFLKFTFLFSLFAAGNIVPFIFLSIIMIVPSIILVARSKLNVNDGDIRYLGIIPIIAPITISISLFLIARYELQDRKIEKLMKNNQVDSRKSLDKKFSALTQEEEKLIDMLIIDEESLVVINNDKRYYQLKLKVEKILKERVTRQGIIDYYIQTRINKNIIENY